MLATLSADAASVPWGLVARALGAAAVALIGVLIG